MYTVGRLGISNVVSVTAEISILRFFHAFKFLPLSFKVVESTLVGIEAGELIDCLNKGGKRL